MQLEMKQITKEFGPVTAVDQVDFSIGTGEIIGLLGENGAGKTTLMNVLSGTFPPTRGEIYINGAEVKNMTPKKSASLGIRFIHQELNLCNDLKIYENMFLGEEKTQNGFLNKKEMKEQADQILRKMELNISSDTLVGELETSHKQLVEIARALLFKCELIIMDEPTTALNNHEIENLFKLMGQLKKENVSFIYISHKMPELFQICDRYMVMRDGKYIASGAFADINEHQATELLIGKTFVDQDIKSGSSHIQKDQVVFSVKNLTAQTFQDVSFDLHKGEIIAITGLQGAGSSELAEALFGILPITDGTIYAEGKTMDKLSIRRAMNHKIAMVPRNRKERGILTDLSIMDNVSMAYFVIKQKGQWIFKNREAERYQRQKQTMNIKADNPQNPITSLSGGNQQKVIIARWLETDADIFLLDSPTQGIDVGAKYEIYKLIVTLAAQGKSIIVFSTEFPEIYRIADRCLIMYKGKINGELSREELQESTVMYYSTGANKEAKE